MYVEIAEKQHYDQTNISLQGDFMTRLKAYGVGFSSYPLETPRGRGDCSVLRETPLVFKRERFPVLWCVLIRALWLCEYVYKMLTTVSLSVTSDPMTSESSRDTVPVSSFRLLVERDPDPVTRSTAHPKSCPPTQICHSFAFSCPLSFNLMHFCYSLKWVYIVLL